MNLHCSFILIMMQSGSDPESPPRAVLLLIASVVPLKRPALATYGCNTFSKRRCAQYRSWLYCHDNESTYIPAGTPHRLINPGVIDLVMIEVQSGEYLGEDDIVRFDDRYGRVAL